ncbi:unnamed protein product [Auanema sp. JU1783]|nr:unnamed protein product [Auanema sp. JU1783]
MYAFNMQFDSLNYIFYSTEALLNGLTLPFSLVLFYYLLAHQQLHTNFRIVMTTLNLANIIHVFNRSTILFARFCCIDNSQDAYILNYTDFFHFFAFWIETNSWIVLIVERTIASTFIDTYEKLSASFVWPSCIVVVVFSPALFISIIVTSGIVNLDALNYLVVQSILVIFTITSISIIMIVNKKAYVNRHAQGLELSSRFQIQEIISSSLYILPVVVFKIVYTICRLLLYTYSYFYGGPMGRDTSHISHVYDNSSAAYRIAFCVYLVLTNSNCPFVKKKGRGTKMDSEITDRTLNHFENLQKQWE